MAKSENTLKVTFQTDNPEKNGGRNGVRHVVRIKDPHRPPHPFRPTGGDIFGWFMGLLVLFVIYAGISSLYEGAVNTVEKAEELHQTFVDDIKDMVTGTASSKKSVQKKEEHDKPLGEPEVNKKLRQEIQSMKEGFATWAKETHEKVTSRPSK